MDFRGAGDPLIFFGPLRGAPGNQACTRRTPGAHQADTRKSAQNRGSARRSPTEGAPLRVCRGLQLALVPWGPWRQSRSGPWRPLVIWRICRPLVICRILPPAGHLTDFPSGPLGHLPDLPWGGPWSSHGFPIRDPRLPVAILGELERIPEEVSGWNGSELNSERIHVRFSRNRRWNSGGWHRPGKAESGGFSRCRGPPDFFRAAARGSKFVP